MERLVLIFLVWLSTGVLGYAEKDGREKPAEGKIAAKPLYRDPVYDGAADPVLCWHPEEKKWLMFYTNRRANAAEAEGVSWVHGTPIGIAESSDGGASWTYRGTANIGYKKGNDTYWAPEVIVTRRPLAYVPDLCAGHLSGLEPPPADSSFDQPQFDRLGISINTFPFLRSGN